MNECCTVLAATTMAAFLPRGKQIVSIETFHEAKLNFFIAKNSETVQSINFCHCLYLQLFSARDIGLMCRPNVSAHYCITIG